MPYDPDLDKVVKQWRSEETGLIAAIHRYAGGEPKLQIGPRVVIKKDGGETQRKAGRMTIEDLMWFYDIIDEVKDELTALAGPE